MRISVNAGHSDYVSGAVGILNEVTEAKAIASALVEELEQRGHDARLAPNIGKTVSAYLAEEYGHANNMNAGLAISVHLNAGGGSGCEVLHSPGDSKGQAYAAEMAANMAGALRLPNRGAKARGDLAFLNNTRMTAVLLEVCFVDSERDATAYRNAGPRNVAQAVADAVSGSSSADVWHVSVDHAGVYPNTDVGGVPKYHVILGTSLTNRGTYGDGWQLFGGISSEHGSGDTGYLRRSDVAEGEPHAWKVWHSVREGAKVHAEATSASRVVKRLEYGEQVGVYATYGVFSRVSVRSGDRWTGYVLTRDLREGYAPTSRTKIYPEGSVSIHEGRDTSSRVLGTVRSGSEVELIATWGRWALVNVGGVRGYVLAERL